jgi:hypothetical protein
MQFTEYFIGVSPDGASSVLELWLLCVADVMLGLRVWCKYWKTLGR